MAGKRVLLIEDNTLTAYLIETTLMENGAEPVATCKTASEAMRLLDLGPLDFVLIDLKLADQFADDIIAEIIARGLKFAVITGMLAFPGNIPDEAVAVLRKPISAQELIDVLVRSA
ncbi:MAG: hypothetical protein R3D67_16275 [Hyphomicrobiaceae bacterium]